MTIYSQHANRGKVQVLATYQCPTGVVSSTVTSVEHTVLATPIVSALNRISFYAAVPTDVWDERARRMVCYPLDHLDALTDRNMRSNLLQGAHSLWYELTMVLLHRALADLESAVANVPGPVKTAITAELDAEARGLRDGFAEYRDGVPSSHEGHRRVWDFDEPLVTVADSYPGIHEQDHDSCIDLEQGLNRVELEQAVADLRLLAAAFLGCANRQARLLIGGFEISDDPYGEVGDRYFLNVQAPMPDGKWKRTNWNIEINKWVPVDPNNVDDGSDASQAVLDCVVTEAPTLSELVGLLNRSNGSCSVLRTWARTAVGKVLAGTSFTVTERYDD